jgi:hypothetical protein
MKRVDKERYDKFFNICDWLEILNLESKTREATQEGSKLQTDKPQRSFVDYLHHENKEALMKKLHELLDNRKGKAVAIGIKALISLSFIAGYKSKNELYKAMEKEFGYIGSNAALNDFLNENSQKLSENDISPTIEILKSIK